MSVPQSSTGALSWHREGAIRLGYREGAIRLAESGTVRMSPRKVRPRSGFLKSVFVTGQVDWSGKLRAGRRRGEFVDVARVEFRPLRRADFPLLAGWLAEPLVARWWNHETSSDAVERDFGSSVDGQDDTSVFLAVIRDRPVGLIQRYLLTAHPPYLEELEAVFAVPAEAVSIDYFIGESDMRGQGVGADMIASFARQTWSAYPDAEDIVVAVAAGNRASWRSLERAGFQRVAVGQMKPDNPRDPRDHYVYRLRRQ